MDNRIVSMVRIKWDAVVGTTWLAQRFVDLEYVRREHVFTFSAPFPRVIACGLVRFVCEHGFNGAPAFSRLLDLYLQNDGVNFFLLLIELLFVTAYYQVGAMRWH